MTRAQRHVLRLVDAGWALWRPAGARDAWAAPPDDRSAVRVRAATLGALVDAGALVERVDASMAVDLADTSWTRPGSADLDFCQESRQNAAVDAHTIKVEGR